MPNPKVTQMEKKLFLIWLIAIYKQTEKMTKKINGLDGKSTREMSIYNLC